MSVRSMIHSATFLASSLTLFLEYQSRPAWHGINNLEAKKLKRGIAADLSYYFDSAKLLAYDARIVELGRERERLSESRSGD